MIDAISSLILDPLTHSFMQRALIMALTIGICCSIFSCFLVLKGWSLMGDAVSHAILPGLVTAYIIGIPLTIGAGIAGLICAASTGFIKAHSHVKEDTILGIIFSGMFALGLVMLTQIESDIHLMHILFGNILGVSTTEILQTTAIAAIATAIMLIKRKDFTLYCFDPSHARVIGLPVKTLHFALLIILTLTIVAALKAAGIILVIAMLITPGAIAMLLSRTMPQMMLTATAASTLSCATGTILSYHTDTPTAPLIVSIQAGLFLAALIWHVSKSR